MTRSPSRHLGLCTGGLVVCVLAILGATFAAEEASAQTPCGGENQRSCCILEPGEICSEGSNPDYPLIGIPGCAGDCACASGGTSPRTCIQPSACGGPGQRACCLIEPRRDDIGGACEAGLHEVPGCVGDCACGTGLVAVTNSTGTCTPDVLPTFVEEPEVNWQPPTEPRSCSLLGYADLHAHLHSDLAHGGNVFFGSPAPIDESGDFTLDAVHNVSSTFSELDDFLFHGVHASTGILQGPNDVIGRGTQDPARHNTGYPIFNNFPHWASTTHQQMYYRWLERAYRGGLRLVVQLAVTNEALCIATGGADCDNSMLAVDLQIQAVHELQDFIDSLYGGPGQGWFRIVTTPLQARQAIADDKMAVVLGIEIDNLFNCKEGGPCPDIQHRPTLTSLSAAVEQYYDFGIRHVFPIHNFDNAFGATATWQDAINVGQARAVGRWQEVENCKPQGYGFRFSPILQFIISLFGFDGQTTLPPAYPGTNDDAVCNRYGLNRTAADQDPRGLGAFLLDELMDRGMIIDVDHMSRKSFDETVALAQDRSYPLVASHVQFFDLHFQNLSTTSPTGRHERMRTLAQLTAIKESGGMIAAMTKDDLQDTDQHGKKLNFPYTPLLEGPIADDCRHSSKTFAQALQYAVDTMEAPVAFGIDFNGIAGHVGPRYGTEACGESDEERSRQLRYGSKLEYPFSLPGFGTFRKQTTNLRTFDFNDDGLAHVGLLPDLVADMKAAGLADIYVDALFNSAEEYIRVWERSVEAGTGVAPPELSPDLTCPPVPLCLGPDTDPPPITCIDDVTAECDGALTQVKFGGLQAGPDLCGTVVDRGCSFSSGDDFLLGATDVGCFAEDDSQNLAQCGFSVRVVDTLAPSIVAPADLPAVECTSPAGASPELGTATASDRCDATLDISHDAPEVFPIGVTTDVRWQAHDDSGNSSPPEVQQVSVVDTVAPLIGCPADIVQECTGDHTATVAPGAATGSDLCSDSVALTSYQARVFDLGTTTLEYVATDAQGLTSSCTSDVSVVDSTPPSISSVVATPDLLWPPNGQMVSVSLEVGAADICDSSAPVCSVVDVSSDEAPGVLAPDWTIEGPLSVRLRSEREGEADGRVYTITVRCEDQAGLTTEASTLVTVPHDQD